MATHENPPCSVYKIKSHTSWNHTVIITTAFVASMDGGLWPLSSCSGIDGLGIPSSFVALVDAGMWSPTGCGGTDGLGIIDVVSDSIDAGLWSPSSSGSTDGFSIPASVDDVADAVIWSRCAVAVLMPWVCLMMLLLMFQLLVPYC